MAILWCENGTTNNGVIYDIMRRTRHQYQYTVRRAKKKNDIMYRRRRLAETSSLNNTNDMWGELKRMNPKGKS